MKTCYKCGSTNRDEAKFCLSCGIRLDQAPPLPAVSSLPTFMPALVRPVRLDVEPASAVVQEGVSNVVAALPLELEATEVLRQSGRDATNERAVVIGPSVIYCRVCSTENDPTNLFCENCGLAMVPASTSPLPTEPEKPGEDQMDTEQVVSQTELPTIEASPEEAAVERAVEEVTFRGTEAVEGNVEERSGTEGVVCPSCATVLRFCPCCGQPLSMNHVEE